MPFILSNLLNKDDKREKSNKKVKKKIGLGDIPIYDPYNDFDIIHPPPSTHPKPLVNLFLNPDYRTFLI